jgi:hypothetical protein
MGPFGRHAKVLEEAHPLLCGQRWGLRDRPTARPQSLMVKRDGTLAGERPGQHVGKRAFRHPAGKRMSG